MESISYILSRPATIFQFLPYKVDLWPSAKSDNAAYCMMCGFTTLQAFLNMPAAKAVKMWFLIGVENILIHHQIVSNKITIPLGLNPEYHS